MASSSRNKVGAESAATNVTVSNSEQYSNSIKKNQKVLIAALIGIVVGVAGFFGYKEFIQKPNEEKAAAALFRAERWFEIDSLNYVINGDGQNDGALAVVNKFGSTDAGNLAHYYLGMSYLRIGEFDNAVTHLNKFSGKNTPFEYLAYGNLGDAYMELEQMDKGIDAYVKAAGNKDDLFITPLYLLRAGLASQKAGKNEDAIKYFQKIKSEYPNSLQGRDIEKHLATLGVID